MSSLRQAATPRGGKIFTGMALAGLVFWGGCRGYSAAPLTLDAATTIAVPVFDNQTYWRGLEFDLTQAVVAEVRSRSALTLVASGPADLTLEGDIVDFSRPVLTEGTQDVIKEGAVRAVVHIIARRRDGAAAVEQTLETLAPFAKSRGENDQTAAAEAWEDLAESIVNLLEKGW